MPDRLAEYLGYHRAMLDSGDADPANPALAYVADRFELNREQRHWLAWLYGCCYCAGTAFYVYNEFPDFENVDLPRLRRWWRANKARTLFQTDRLWVRSRDQFPPMFESYRALVGRSTQEQLFRFALGPDPRSSYDAVFALAGTLYQFGRFALFLYLDVLADLTGLPVEPTGLDLRHSESSRNGLCYALGRDGWITGKETGNTSVPKAAWGELDEGFRRVLSAARSQDRPGGPRSTVWNVETTLCAYKKFKRGKRYVGYYLDRQADEIRKLESRIPDGVAWSVLWDFRRETFRPEFLAELRP